MTEQLEVYTFGGLRILLDGKPVTGFTSRKVEALLAYLFVSRRPHPREVLADFLWEDFSQTKAMNNLRVVLSNLRKHLGDYVTINREAAGPNEDSHNWIDAIELEVNLNAAQELEIQEGRLTAKGARHIQKAVALYEGEFLEGFSARAGRGFDEWVSFNRERFKILLLEGLGKLAGWQLEQGEYPAGIQTTTIWLQIDPLMEAAHRQKMRLLASNGQIGAALEQYKTCVQVLNVELGVQPSEETIALYEYIKDGELPSLALQSDPITDEEREPPFKGLQYFDVKDAPLFFGRESLTNKLVNILRDNRFLAVVGASGSGKSSVVRAGLIPAINGEKQLSDGSRPPVGSKWLVHLITPTDHPLEALAASLTRDSESVTATATLIDDLSSDHRSLLLFIRKLLSQSGQARLLLVVDQFEELFTLCHDEVERKTFIDNLITAVGDEKSGPITLLITLRADFYAHCAQYAGLWAILEKQQALISQMEAEELRRAIEGPANKEGYVFEPGLVDLILRDIGVTEEGQPEPGALPLLSHALMETWKRRSGQMLTFAGYSATGGVRGAIAQTAEQVFYDKLTNQQQDIAKGIFLRLTELGEGTQDTRRRATLEELIPNEEQASAVDTVLQTLADARLVTTSEGTAEVAHEALIREWSRLREWLDEGREGLRIHRQLMEASQGWKALDREQAELYRGARLARANTWMEEEAPQLNPLEREFLAASQAFEEREAEERQALEARSRRFLRILVAVLAIATLISSGLGVFAFQQQQKALGSAADAQNTALIAGSQSSLANEDTGTALALAWQAVRLNPNSALAQAQLSEAAYAPGIVRQYLGNGAIVDEIAISSNGSILAGGEHDKLILWNVANGQIIQQFDGHSGDIWDVAFSPDGQRIASSSADLTTIIWDANTAEKIQVLGEHTAGISAVEFSPDGLQIITGDFGENSKLILWDAQTGDKIRRFEHDSPIRNIQFMPNGSSILFGDFAGKMILLSIETGEVIHEMNPGPNGELGPLSRVAISPDGLTAISGFQSFFMFHWDLKSGELIREFDLGDQGVESLVFHPDNENVLVGESGNFKIIDLLSGETVESFTFQGGQAWDAVFLPDSRYVIVTTDLGPALWDLSEGQVIEQIANFDSRIMEVDISANGKLGLIGTGDGIVSLWDMQTRDTIHQLVDDQQILAVTFSPDSQTALIGAGYLFGEKRESGHIILWDINTGNEIRRFDGHPFSVVDVEFSPDGQLAVSSGAGAMVILWDIQTGEEIWRFDDYWADEPTPLISFWDVEFSPDGQTIFAAYSEGLIVALDVESGQEVGRLEGHDNGMPGVVFSHNGEIAATSGWDGQAIIWDVHSMSINYRLTNHVGPLGQIRFTPDSLYLLGGSADGMGSLWDVDSGEVIRRYFHGGFMRAPDFSPDGSQALVGFQGGRVELWRIDRTLEQLLEWIKANRQIPELSCEERELYLVQPLCEPKED